MEDAEKRGLLNLKTTVDALPSFIADKNIELFERHGVFTKTELHSRYEIMLENYQKTLHIEALTMVDMVKKYVIPAALDYQNELLTLKLSKDKLGIKATAEDTLLNKLSELTNTALERLNELEDALVNANMYSDTLELARYYRDTVFKDMSNLRVTVDEMEATVAKKYWTLPTYAELLYSVN